MSKDNNYTDKKIQAINLILQNKKNFEITKEIGIDEATFLQWLEEKEFIEALNDALIKRVISYKKRENKNKETKTKEIKIVLSMEEDIYKILLTHFENNNKDIATGILEIIQAYMKKNRLV